MVVLSDRSTQGREFHINILLHTLKQNFGFRDCGQSLLNTYYTCICETDGFRVKAVFTVHINFCIFI